MDIRNVVVLTDGKKFKKSDVVKVIIEEGYKHNFMFIKGSDNAEKYLKQADEVWCFGDCTNSVEYKIGQDINVDFWIMG